MDPGPWNCYPTSSPISPNFSWFFCYLIAIFHLNKRSFPNLEMHPGPWKGTMDPENSPNVAINHPYFFLILSIFYDYFSFGKAHVSLFGSAHWTLTTTPNVVSNHPYFFPRFFHILWLFFIWKSACFLIWKCTGPWKQPPMSSSTVSNTLSSSLQPASPLQALYRL